MSRLIGLTIRHLFPGYFALVMATGIVSIGTFLLDMRRVAWALFLVNAVAYASPCLLKRYPLRYDPLYWDIVFPLGMYTTCTLQLAQATKLRLETISECLIYFALAAWLVVFLGLLWQMARTLFCSRSLHVVRHQTASELFR